MSCPIFLSQILYRISFHFIFHLLACTIGSASSNDFRPKEFHSFIVSLFLFTLPLFLSDLFFQQVLAFTMALFVEISVVKTFKYTYQQCVIVPAGLYDLLYNTLLLLSSCISMLLMLSLTIQTICTCGKLCYNMNAPEDVKNIEEYKSP